MLTAYKTPQMHSANIKIKAELITRNPSLVAKPQSSRIAATMAAPTREITNTSHDMCIHRGIRCLLIESGYRLRLVSRNDIGNQAVWPTQLPTSKTRRNLQPSTLRDTMPNKKVDKPNMAESKPLIDPESPWKVTLRDWNWPYSYTGSASEWQDLLARAKRGNPEAEWEVADRYADGSKDQTGKVVVKRSRTKAAMWFRRAAKHGSVAAQNALGVLLGDGDWVKKDIDEALTWLRRAFSSGDSCASQNIAITYRQVGELRGAVRWFQRSADAGDGDALVQLGIHYYWGKGVRRNPKEAIRCFRAATRSNRICEAGKDDAFFFLGIAYSEGKGVTASIKNARKFFERANIDNDHRPAKEMLRRLRE